MPSLRRDKAFRVIRKALGVACDRFGARITHYAVLSNHFHFVMEAESAPSLSRALQGLGSRLAQRLNKHFGRSGKLFRDRYYARTLRTPLEVRRVLAYVLNNQRRHARLGGNPAVFGFFDPFSSAPFFDGWAGEWQCARGDPRHTPDPLPALPRGVARPRSALLTKSWRRFGLLRPF